MINPYQSPRSLTGVRFRFRTPTPGQIALAVVIMLWLERMRVYDRR